MRTTTRSVVIDARAGAREVARAVALLRSSRGTVNVEGVCGVSATADRLFFEVPDPLPDQHRCAEELAVLLENARRAFAATTLAASLPDLPQEWRVKSAS